MPRYFLTPSVVLSGANDNVGACGSYHPLHCSANTRKRWCFFSKTASPKKPKFSILLSRGTTMPPIVAKTGKITVIQHVITITIHPGHDYWPEMVVWVYGVYTFSPESQVIKHVYVSLKVRPVSYSSPSQDFRTGSWVIYSKRRTTPQLFRNMCMIFIRRFVVCIIVQSRAFLLVVFATLSRIRSYTTRCEPSDFKR